MIIILKKIFNRLYRYKKIISIIPKLYTMKSNHKKVFLFGCPFHPNLGDLAQTMCLEEWLYENYSEFKIVKFDKLTSYPFALKILRKKIRSDDLIFFHSGYHIVDHHPDLPYYCEVIKKFPDFRIVVFPQTVNLHGEKKRKEITEIFNSHPNLNLMCRDEVSYELAKPIFQNCNLLLIPDVVTTLIGRRRYETKRNGILFLIRDDVEAYYSTSDIQSLRSRLSKKFDTNIMDTSIKINTYSVDKYRDILIENYLEENSSYDLVITDRYHGTIFSLVSNTPVIVLGSTDHKLSSGVKWFPPEFKDYIVFAEDLEMAYDLALNMLKKKQREQLSPYFKCNQYVTLRDKLSES